MPMEPMLNSYNDNSAIQETCQTVGNPILAGMVAQWADGRRNGDLRFVRIADYGCSGGRNSVAPVRDIVTTLTRTAPGIRVECVLEDLPTNAWDLAIQQGGKLSSDFPNVHVLCAGTSFYNQVCADNSVDLAYSYVASHFLSQPQPLSTHVLMHESTNGEKKAWEQQAAQDWKKFLLLRARELKQGAKLMISTMSRDEAGYSWKAFSYLVWDAIQSVLAKGGLTKREAESLCIPACLRAEADIMAPFSSDPDVQAAFHVDALGFSRTSIQEEDSVPVADLASLLRRRTESVWGGMFVTELIRLGRTGHSARETMKQVWDLFEEALLKDPGNGWRDMRFYCLQLTRQ